MAFNNTNKNEIFRNTALVLLTFPLVVSANIDCGGKAFHCVNATHFMVCVDLGGGVSSTIDSFIIPCPPSTECQKTNYYECEFPTKNTVTAIYDSVVNSESSKTVIESTSTISATESTTNIPLTETNTGTSLTFFTPSDINSDLFTPDEVATTTILQLQSQNEEVTIETTSVPTESAVNNVGIYFTTELSSVSVDISTDSITEGYLASTGNITVQELSQQTTNAFVHGPVRSLTETVLTEHTTENLQGSKTEWITQKNSRESTTESFTETYSQYPETFPTELFEKITTNTIYQEHITESYTKPIFQEYTTESIGKNITENSLIQKDYDVNVTTYDKNSMTKNSAAGKFSPTVTDSGKNDTNVESTTTYFSHDIDESLQASTVKSLETPTEPESSVLAKNYYFNIPTELSTNIGDIIVINSESDNVKNIMDYGITTDGTTFDTTETKAYTQGKWTTENTMLSTNILPVTENEVLSTVNEIKTFVSSPRDIFPENLAEITTEMTSLSKVNYITEESTKIRLQSNSEVLSTDFYLDTIIEQTPNFRNSLLSQPTSKINDSVTNTSNLRITEVTVTPDVGSTSSDIQVTNPSIIHASLDITTQKSFPKVESTMVDVNIVESHSQTINEINNDSSTYNVEITTENSNLQKQFEEAKNPLGRNETRINTNVGLQTTISFSETVTGEQISGILETSTLDLSLSPVNTEKVYEKSANIDFVQTTTEEFLLTDVQLTTYDQLTTSSKEPIYSDTNDTLFQTDSAFVLPTYLIQPTTESPYTIKTLIPNFYVSEADPSTDFDQTIGMNNGSPSTPNTNLNFQTTTSDSQIATTIFNEKSIIPAGIESKIEVSTHPVDFANEKKSFYGIEEILSSNDIYRTVSPPKLNSYLDEQTTISILEISTQSSVPLVDVTSDVTEVNTEIKTRALLESTTDSLKIYESLIDNGIVPSLSEISLKNEYVTATINLDPISEITPYYQAEKTTTDVNNILKHSTKAIDIPNDKSKIDNFSLNTLTEVPLSQYDVGETNIAVTEYQGTSSYKLSTGQTTQPETSKVLIVENIGMGVTGTYNEDKSLKDNLENVNVETQFLKTNENSNDTLNTTQSKSKPSYEMQTKTEIVITSTTNPIKFIPYAEGTLTKDSVTAHKTNPLENYENSEPKLGLEHTSLHYVKETSIYGDSPVTIIPTVTVEPIHQSDIKPVTLSGIEPFIDKIDFSNGEGMSTFDSQTVILSVQTTGTKDSTSTTVPNTPNESLVKYDDKEELGNTRSSADIIRPNSEIRPKLTSEILIDRSYIIESKELPLILEIPETSSSTRSFTTESNSKTTHHHLVSPPEESLRQTNYYPLLDKTVNYGGVMSSISEVHTESNFRNPDIGSHVKVKSNHDADKYSNAGTPISSLDVIDKIHENNQESITTEFKIQPFAIKFNENKTAKSIKQVIDSQPSNRASNVSSVIETISNKSSYIENDPKFITIINTEQQEKVAENVSKAHVTDGISDSKNITLEEAMKSVADLPSLLNQQAHTPDSTTQSTTLYNDYSNNNALLTSETNNFQADPFFTDHTHKKTENGKILQPITVEITSSTNIYVTESSMTTNPYNIPLIQNSDTVINRSISNDNLLVPRSSKSNTDNISKISVVHQAKLLLETVAIKNHTNKDSNSSKIDTGTYNNTSSVQSNVKFSKTNTEISNSQIRPHINLSMTSNSKDHVVTSTHSTNSNKKEKSEVANNSNFSKSNIKTVVQQSEIDQTELYLINKIESNNDTTIKSENVRINSNIPTTVRNLPPALSTLLKEPINYNKTIKSPETEVKFQNPLLSFCRNRSRGRYSDRDDCTKFYICIGRSEPIVGKCPANTVFSELNKQCTKNVSHCFRNNKFKCISEGRFIDIVKQNIYYICVQRAHTFIRFEFRCQDGYNLNKTIVKCIPDKTQDDERSAGGHENDQSEKESTEVRETSKESKHKRKENKKDHSKEKFECTGEGKFVDPHNCKKYYVCTKNKKSVFRKRRKSCDSDERFHDDKKKCVDSSSYECQ